jgi:hypothetical protein
MPASDRADGGLHLVPAPDEDALLQSAHEVRERSRRLRAEMRERLDRLGDLHRGRAPGPTPPSPRSVLLLERLHEQLVTAQTRIGHLETALASNRRIGIAVGILMARDRLTEQAAFDRLSRHSQQRNIKLRELAEQVIYTGSL